MNPVIESAHFQLTVRCNLRCSFCGQSRGMAGVAAKEITPEKWLSTAEELKEFYPANTRQTITLWGGEPTLYDGFALLAEELYKRNFRLDVVTNATNIGRFSCELNRFLSNIFVSLDGVGDMHDAVRGKGVFEKVRENLKLLNKRSGKLVFLCTLSDVNVESADTLPHKMAELGCDAVIFQQLMYLTEKEIANYRSFSMKNFNCDYPELAGWKRDDDASYRKTLAAVMDKIKSNNYPVPVRFTPHAYWMYPDAAPCSISQKRIHVRHDGEVGFCTDYFGFSAGNINRMSLKTILSGKRYQTFFSAVKSNALATCDHCPWRLQ